MFEAWEATGNVTKACAKAHVGRGTFYYWKPRFETGGYAGVGTFASRAPKEPVRTAKEVEERVIEMRRKHPEWGKQRLTDELARGNNWVPLASPNTVRRILQDAGLWPEPEITAKKGGPKT